MSFFTYRQNNSGGSFDRDDSVDKWVIIEADSPLEANARALRLGIYFDGVPKGIDCDCCGDRWVEAWAEGDETPSAYGNPVNVYHESRLPQRNGWVHYKDGRKMGFQE